MNYFDIFVLIFIGIFAIIGLSKGFVKIIFSFSKKIIAFIVAYFLVGPFRNILLPTKLGMTINASILGWVVEKNATLASLTDPTAADLEALSESMNIPKFLCEMLLKLVEEDLTGKTLGQLIADTLTYYAVTAIAYILLVIILMIVVSLLSSVLNSLFETVFLKPINRILGMGLNTIIALLFISLILLGLNALAPTVTFVGEFVETYIDPSNPDFGITRYLYNNNILIWVMNNVINIEDVFN